MTSYPSGRYVCTYEGTPPTYNSDGVKIESTYGRDVLEVTPTIEGIYISTTGPLKNLSVVQEQYEELLKGGKYFHPRFLEKLSIMRGKVVRFMDWQGINNNPARQSWAKRAKVTDAFWGTEKGVPLEVIINLCNRMEIHPWFNLHHTYSLSSVESFTRMVRDGLCPGLIPHFELSNECWNSAYYYQPQLQWMQKHGQSLWPDSTLPIWEKGWQYYGLRTTQIGSIIKKIIPRSNMVLSSQAVNSYLARQSLACPLWDQKVKVDCLAIAPYISPLDPDNFHGTMDEFFASIPSFIDKAMEGVKAHKVLADEYGLELAAYEGGQGFVSTDQVMNDFYMQAQRDPRMTQITLDYLAKWKENGGGLFCYFSFCSAQNKWGAWGALESVMQETSPKYEALKQFGGVSLNGVSYWSSEMPFLDLVKNNGDWVPQGIKGSKWGTGQPVDRDENNWINSVPVGETVGLLLNRGM